MRRISRLSKPSGARLASTTARPLAPLCVQRTAKPSPAPAVQINTLRFYSSRQPDTLPGSLGAGKTEAAPAAPETDVVEEVLEEERVELEAFDQTQSPQRVFVPPPRPSVAERADEITDTLYTPATTAEGLESIGRLGNWWDDPEHWPETSDFVGFTPKQKVQEPVLLEAAVRRALTEVLVMKQLGREEQLTERWGLQDKEQHDAVLALDVRVDNEGNATVTGDLHSVADELLVDEIQSNTDVTYTLPSAAEALAWKQQADQSWKGASLQDARLKFAVSCTSAIQANIC